MRGRRRRKRGELAMTPSIQGLWSWNKNASVGQEHGERKKKKKKNGHREETKESDADTQM